MIGNSSKRLILALLLFTTINSISNASIHINLGASYFSITDIDADLTPGLNPDIPDPKAYLISGVISYEMDFRIVQLRLGPVLEWGNQWEYSSHVMTRPKNSLLRYGGSIKLLTIPIANLKPFFRFQITNHINDELVNVWLNDSLYGYRDSTTSGLLFDFLLGFEYQIVGAFKRIP